MRIFICCSDTRSLFQYPYRYTTNHFVPTYFISVAASKPVMTDDVYVAKPQKWEKSAALFFLQSLDASVKI